MIYFLDILSLFRKLNGAESSGSSNETCSCIQQYLEYLTYTKFCFEKSSNFSLMVRLKIALVLLVYNGFDIKTLPQAIKYGMFLRLNFDGR